MPRTNNETQPETPTDEVEVAAPAVEETAGDFVKVKVTKFGAGKISTGEHVAEKGDVMADKDTLLMVDQAVADALEKKGFAEIVE